jgi:hypothetical protein
MVSCIRYLWWCYVHRLSLCDVAVPDDTFLTVLTALMSLLSQNLLPLAASSVTLTETCLLVSSAEHGGNSWTLGSICHLAHLRYLLSN